MSSIMRGLLSLMASGEDTKNTNMGKVTATKDIFKDIAAEIRVIDFIE